MAQTYPNIITESINILSSWDYTIFIFNPSSSTVIISLPAISSINNFTKVYIINNISSNSISLACNKYDTINGQYNIIITILPNNSIKLISSYIDNIGTWSIIYQQFQTDEREVIITSEDLSINLNLN